PPRARRLLLTGTAASESSALSLHDALPICRRGAATGGLARRHGGAGGAHGALCGDRRHRGVIPVGQPGGAFRGGGGGPDLCPEPDRKSTRLNSSHVKTS